MPAKAKGGSGPAQPQLAESVSFLCVSLYPAMGQESSLLLFVLVVFVTLFLVELLGQYSVLPARQHCLQHDRCRGMHQSQLWEVVGSRQCTWVVCSTQNAGDCAKRLQVFGRHLPAETHTHITSHGTAMHIGSRLGECTATQPLTLMFRT